MGGLCLAVEHRDRLNKKIIIKADVVKPLIETASTGASNVRDEV